MKGGKLAMCLFMVLPAMQACSHKDIYTSTCAEGIVYKRIKFSAIIDSIKLYDKQYVEVSGKYVEGKNLSALVNDSTFANHDNKKALWVNFSQDCPLVLVGSKTGLFEYGDGDFSKINNHLMTIRGKIDMHQKGPVKNYKGAIDMVSFVEIR